MKTLYYFTSPTCGPCKMFRPVVENTVSELGIPTNYIDISRSMDLANKYDVKSVPTSIIMEDNQILRRHVGIMSKDQFKQFINNG
jgi:thioredoxin 1